MKRRTFLCGLAGAAAGGVAGCLASTDDGESDATVGSWSGGTIEFALPPFQDAEDLHAQYAGVFEWLEDGFDGVDTVEGVPTTDYSGVIESVVHGHTELANLAPMIYALSADDGIHPLAINWSHGAESYHTYIATRADTGIDSLADLEGTRIAMVDPLSASGGMFPRYTISQAGLDAGDIETEPADFDIEWAGGHDAALAALEEGHVDAAAYGDFQHPDTDEIQKVARSDPIPFDAVVAKPDTPEPVREALIERLVETPPEALEEHRIDRFGEIEPGTYDPVRDIAREMGVEVADLEEDETEDTNGNGDTDGDE
ncbi:phosphate/phosphite/phosphonate ABC transporter substrate-binding protein [Natronobiforma cellulositropha]|uniref:phosphate/phosphite/phosphonate ABC transporter substrate-binding protein n=1 Tax=Natronobiforma cellulositropha TaxID=1679076 RepID=UPI0021D5C092|nr:phosphate/phosphite/phosphonate ABC transporter substrate-binding protein [Natronobiforma cellulositropha]